MTTQPPPVHEAFAAVYAEHYDPLIRLAHLTTGDLAAAEDIVQDAFVELFRQWSQVQEPAAWLRRAVANRSVSWLRRLLTARRHLARGPSADPVGPPADPDPQIRAALAKLRPRQRAAVFLRYYLDLSEAQTAAALGCRPGTVKSLLHRALGTLRGQLDGD